MTRHSISKKQYLALAQVFHWAKKEHYQWMLTGKPGRHSRTEKILPRLVRERRLVAIRYGAGLVYAARRRARTPRNLSLYRVEHGLACTECLVRAWLSKPVGALIAERSFTRRFPIIPEWGIRYPDGKLLLCEFSTQDNFQRSGLILRKIERYQNSLSEMKQAFACQEVLILFVAEVERMRVQRLVYEHDLPSSFFFTDYDSFLRVGYHQQLQTPIYFWKDGNTYPIAYD